MTKIFNSYLRDLEEGIEKAEEKKDYLVALEYTNRAIGITRFAYYCSIIDEKELELLFDKLFDYRVYYTMLLN